jgi:ABC-type antimicrobial peptide transport system permease subunit
VLRTIGFERRDVRATIAYQATVLGLVGLVVGVPAGIAVGRVVWGAVADGLGVPSEVGVPLVALVLVAVGALLVANVIGGIAATSAIRDRPAAALAAE